MTELLPTVRRWIELDPDPRTRAELQELLSSAESGDQAAETTLSRLFSGRLAFGTAGLRAELGPGPMRMNRLVVRQTAAGLLRYATETLSQARTAVDNPHDVEGPRAHRIVIGYDARHQSDEFAFETAALFSSAGWDVHLFDKPTPTPLLARQVLVLDAEIGIMVTASHNPPRDNGYKVYLGGELSRFLEPDGHGVGAQIVSPVDREIADAIAETVGEDFAESSATPAATAEAQVHRPHGVTTIGQQARDSYQQEALELLDPETYPHRDLRIVYTAMHGVGGEAVTSLLRAAGFAEVIPVAEQFEPDPEFPTAAFPNPEEAGALDLALHAAQEHQADLVLANDPDADRLSAAVFDEEAGQWRQLSGDEMGALLGRHLLERGPLREGWQTTGTGESTEPAVANSVVSSRLLGRLAAGRGVTHADTLTGFKWLARVPNIVFGYEEAIGFDVDPVHVRDKDGVSAALIFSELVADLKAKGTSVVQALDEIAAEAGLFLTSQVTVKVDDLSQLGRVTAALRADPPREIAGSRVVESLDLTQEPLPGQEFSEARSTDALIWFTESDDRVIVRPSGTEPKVKCYLEAVSAPASESAEDIARARSVAAERLEQLRESMTSLLKK
ncbi:phospho-sugar mutase [Nesterenkonia flava]|uniref:Phospho-sugar mutase n=1 Tax=Nesterenkonia flava TaxID=469799 RepID=A0ABU1FSJ4_9MICC|nr:phospho-sugar mutase [Nesterenkonia flava]MDR5711302.1 phospho-sugar mutase [Nesterenkonia flava]